jgi:hypothetical protein
VCARPVLLRVTAHPHRHGDACCLAVEANTPQNRKRGYTRDGGEMQCTQRLTHRLPSRRCRRPRVAS